MFKSYVVVAFRNFLRNKIFTLINVLGLSIGISSSLVIFLIAQYDLSFDRFEKNGDRLYRVVSEYVFQGGNPGHTRGVPGPLGDAVKKELTGIEKTVNFRYYNVQKLAVAGTNSAKASIFKAPSGIIFADDSYFTILPYKWLAGPQRAALEKQNRVVLSESNAKLYFPSLSYEEMIGRKIVYDDSITALVSGVVQDLNRQGHTDFNFKEFISLSTLLNNSSMRSQSYWDEWGSTTSDHQLYVELSKGATSSSVEAKLKKLFNKYLGEDAKKNNYKWSYLLQPLSDIHFNNNYGNFNVQLANKSTLYGLITVAVFLLILGCINFINLATAQASQRSKEIGIRKTMGSSRRQLILQFLCETFIITLLATVISLTLTPLLLKVFANFIPEGVHFSMTQPSLLAFLVALVFIVSMLAGFYPAVMLSSANPSLVLKNQAYGGTGKTRKAWLRQTLTVFQFIVAQTFIISAFLVGKQIRFMLDKDLGFNKDAILSFKTPSSDPSILRRTHLLHELRNIPGITLASLGRDMPSSFGWWTTDMKYIDGKKELQNVVELKSGDSNYLKLFQIPIIAGRNLFPSDTIREILVNETFVKVLGFRNPQDAVGKMVSWNDKKTPIVGVVKDFHAHPLSYEIKPLAVCQSADTWNNVIIKLRPHDLHAGMGVHKESNDIGNEWRTTIAKIEKIYKENYQGEEFSYTFFDENIANAYNNQQNISNLLKWATGLTIFISCLGLLGLVIFTTNNRVKEIGIRKVLGASVTQIVSILSKDFVKLVAIAFLIAAPLSWWALNTWLDNFAFKTAFSWWIFLVSGFGMITIALITLSVQTIRAAIANPVKSLRTE